MNNRPPFLLQIFGILLIAASIGGLVVAIGGFALSGTGSLEGYSIMGAVFVSLVCTAIAGKGFFDGSKLRWAILAPPVVLVIGYLAATVFNRAVPFTTPYG
ncbi:MAG: hypothetical protein Q7S60_04455 [bacterium]|nr:hypothetical protein [bacterium]